MKYLAILLFILATHSVSAEPLRIMFIGESTSLGYYDGVEHEESSIPLMLKQNLEAIGIPVAVDNKAVISTTVGWHLANSSFSASDIVIIQLGINDAVNTEVCQFINDCTQLIDTVKQVGKTIYIAMPNKIFGSENIQLEYYAYLMEKIGIEKSMIVVGSSAQEVPLSDVYHPTPAGYEMLGENLKNRLVKDISVTHVTKLYIALFNRVPEKEGLDYWSDKMSLYGRDLIAQQMVSFTGVESDSDFIDLIYFNTMNRVPDVEGKNYWMNSILNYGRGATLNTIIGILEEKSKCKN